jgi:hypothetical protein
MRTIALAIGLAAALSPSSGVASPVSVTFTGVITVVDDPTGEAGMSTGTPFTATAVYDDGSSAPPTPVEGGVMSYNWIASPPASISFQAGSWQIGTGPFHPGDASLGPGLGLDLADRISDGTFFADAVRWYTVVDEVSGLDVPFYVGEPGIACCSMLDIHLLGNEGTLPSLSLAEIPFDLDAWAAARISVSLWMDPFLDNEIFVLGTITSISVIPEPSTLALVGTALLGLAAGRRTRGRPGRAEADRRSATLRGDGAPRAARRP